MPHVMYIWYIEILRHKSEERVVRLIGRHVKKSPNKSVTFPFVGNCCVCVGRSNIFVEKIPNFDLLGCGESPVLFNNFNSCLSSLGGGRGVRNGSGV